MVVRVGKVELTGVQAVRTDENRNLAEQRVPGQAGSVVQDLGRDPVILHLQGVLLGEPSLEAMETLRTAQSKAEPMSFAADVAVGTEITDVLVEDFKVRQVAGHTFRYQFAMRLREHIEPPEPPGAGLAEVEAEISVEADGWGGDAMGALDALDDPTLLSGLLGDSAGLLDVLDMGELGDSLADLSGDLLGADFSDILQAISKIDPQQVIELVEAIRDADSLGDFLGKYVDEGLDILEDLTGIDLEEVGDLIQGFAQGTDFLQKLKRVQEAAEKLIGDLGDFNLLGGLPELGGNA